MKNLLKKAAITLIAVVSMSVAVQAQQKGDMAVGGNLVIGTGNSYTNIGIEGKYQYNVTNPIRLEGSFTYFLKKDFVSMWDLSVNGHYLFPVSDKITVYPLFGLGVLGSSASVKIGDFGVSSSSTNFGVNIGGGLDYKLTDKLVFNTELKYKFADVWDRLLISAGLAYKF